MSSIVETVLKIGDWLQQKVKTKSGIFVIGTLLGVVPSATVSFILYQDGIYKNEKLIQEFERTKEIEKEKDVWQERAFNAETTCLEKIKEMASFFQGLEGMYKTEEINNKKVIDNDKEKLDRYEDITNRLSSLKNDLEDEK